MLLPPSEGKADPTRGRPVDLGRLSFPSLTEERERLLGADLRHAPTRPAREIYTGVLYAALDLPTLPAAAQRRVLIISAQFGALRPADRIPPYRRSMDAARWRPLLADALGPVTRRGVLLDCRSAAYAAAWRAPGERTAHVRVERDVRGARQVVSHDAKRTRGEVARHLLSARTVPATVVELAACVAEGFRVELAEPAADGRPWELTVVV